jgi:biotin/methionine sulfoxide reductase
MTDEDNPGLNHASHWGTFTARRNGNHRLEVVPSALDPAPSDLLRSISDTVSHANRVHRPAARSGWLARDTGAGRGKDPYIEVSWEEALDLVAREIERVRVSHGNASIFAGSYGWASAGRYHHPKTQLNRLLNLVGGYTGHVGTYSYGASAAILPHVLGSADPGAGDLTSWDAIVENTDLLIAFGGLPLRCTQVSPGGMGRHTTAEWLQRLAARKTKVVHVSPVKADTPTDLNADWWAPRPGTDVVLMLAMMYTLVDEGLHDQEFVNRCCSGTETLLAYLSGQLDGQEKTPAWAGEISGIAPVRIADLARRLVRQRTMISTAWALQRAHHGEQTYWATVALASLVGQIGLPGGGFGFAYGTGQKGEPESHVKGPTLSAGPNPAGSAIPVARIADMLLAPGKEYDFNGQRLAYPDVRLVYWAGGNPFHHHQDLNRLVNAWRCPETVVVNEPYWTATARHADIVLPSTTTLERNDLGYGNRDRFIIAMKKVLDPVGEARDDVVIFRELAARLGVEAEFTQDRDEMAWLRWMWDETRDKALEHEVRLLEFDDFWAAGHAELPAPAAPKVLYSEFRRNPDANRLSTPSGKIELASRLVESFGYADCPGYPCWLEPAEWLGSKMTDRFPLHLITYQPGTRLHSQLDQGSVSAESKIQGREPCQINAVDAAARGIVTGDVVRLFNDRGSCLAGAVVTDDVRQGVIAMAIGAWYDPVEWGVSGSLEKHGNPNVLTLDLGTSKLGQATSAQTTLAQVERYRGEPLPVTAHQPPAFVERSGT